MAVKLIKVFDNNLPQKETACFFYTSPSFEVKTQKILQKVFGDTDRKMQYTWFSLCGW